MNRSELIVHIAAAADISQDEATRALDAILDAITDALKNSEAVSLVGFGTFTVKHRAARAGRNPQTGQQIEIAAANVPTFRPGKTLKDLIGRHGFAGIGGHGSDGGLDD